MLKFTPCADAPLFKAGIAVDSLYFTKAPGNKYLSIYARYKNNTDWVPLHIGLPAVPTLQQVRDMDRNIALNTGSYDDAHFYLRSAEGNNMTAAYYTNAHGAAIQAGNVAGFEPLNLQPEGGLLTYNNIEVATQDWVKRTALVKKNDVVTNFNAVTTAGIYQIPSNLSSVANYPHIGNNNNGATSGMLIVYDTPAALIQYFYPNNETNSMNRSGGFWYRKGFIDPWEYKNGVLEINLRTATTLVHVDQLLLNGEYLITASNTTQYASAGLPESGATIGGIPFMLTVRKKFGNAPWVSQITQELVSIQESAANRTRKWMRSKFNWAGENAHAWDAWNEVGLLRDVYTKIQLNTPGAGGHVHWDNIDNKPSIVNAETDPTVPGHVKSITTTNISSWNAKEDAVNKSTNIALGTSNVLYPSENAVKAYVDNKITSNNTGFIPIAEKGAVNGIATLGANGKIPNAQIPALAITETFPVNSQAAMLALAAETGDVAVRNDISKSFILQNTPASTLSNWIELKSPSVDSTDQVPEGTLNLYFTSARARAAISAKAPVTYNNGNGIIGITQAGSSSNGYLSATDWTTFSNKQNALGFIPENTGNKATSLTNANNTTYPTTRAVSNAISAAAANLQQTTDRGNTTTNALVAVGSEGREVKTYIPVPTTINGIVSGSTYKWYNDLVTIGAVRTGTSTVEGFGIDINGTRQLTLDTAGNLNLPGQGDFNSLIAHNSISAFNTQPYTSGAKYIAIWNGSTGRFEYTNEVFLTAESDPVFSNARPNLMEAAVYMTDINTVVKSGVSYTDPGTANTFTGDPYNSVLTFIGASNTNNAWVNQIVAPTTNGSDLFYRRKTNGNAWTSPEKFAFQSWVNNNTIRNQFAGGQAANIWLSGDIRANRFDLANGQNITWGGSYNPGIPTISAATGVGIGFYPDGSNGANGGMLVSFPAAGSIKVAALASGTTAMVVADGNGLLKTQAIPGTQEQWQDIHGYNYLSPNSPGYGTGRGIDTNGGFAAMGREINAASYAVKNDDYILLFHSKTELALPNPNAFPGRILKLRSSPGNEVTFRDYSVLDFGDTLSSLRERGSMEIQAIAGAWHLVMVGY